MSNKFRSYSFVWESSGHKLVGIQLSESCRDISETCVISQSDYNICYSYDLTTCITLLCHPGPVINSKFAKLSITHLSLYVHECDRVATVTDDKLVIALWQYVYGVDGDITL